MRKLGHLALSFAGAISLALLFVPSTFADSRHSNETYLVARHDRVSIDGRVTRIDRRYGGFVITLDHGEYTFFVQNLEVRRAPRRMYVDDLRNGAFIRIAGYPGRRGYIDVDVVEWLGGGDGGRYEHATLRGVVHRIDNRYETVQIRNEDNGRIIVVDMRSVDRHRRGADLDDLRRGDRVTLAGNWTGEGYFHAERIEWIRSRY